MIANRLFLEQKEKEKTKIIRAVKTYQDKSKKNTKNVYAKVNRLTANVQTWLIPFIDRLKGVRTKSKIAAICAEEMAYIEIRYPNSTTRHRLLTDYRNALKKRYSAVETLSDGRENPKHYAFELMKLNQDEAKKRVEKTRKNVGTRSSNRVTFDLQEHINLCNNLLNDDDVQNLALGIMAVTGRRPIEVLKTASFEMASKNQLIFSGQTKTREGENTRDNYIIPCLVNADIVVSALEKLRRILPLKGIDHRQVNNKLSSNLNKKIKNIYSKLELNKHIRMTCKGLRSMYAGACFELFNHDNSKSFSRYVGEILGHSEDDQTTSQSYEYFTPARQKLTIESFEH